jgi:hypothetical protein
MKRLISALAVTMALCGAVSTSGCVVRERRVATGPGGCPGGYFVGGHYGPRGRWHEGHWRCPGVVERVEID